MVADFAILFVEQLKDVIQDLYQLMVQVHSYDAAGVPSAQVLEQNMYASLLPPTIPHTLN